MNKKYTLDTGEIIDIFIDEVNTSIVVTAQDGGKIGKIEFDDNGECYHICWMYLDELGDKYLKKGIGQECLLFLQEYIGCCITAAYDNGLTNDYGDYLTGDAPAFIAKMRDKGIVRE